MATTDSTLTNMLGMVFDKAAQHMTSDELHRVEATCGEYARCAVRQMAAVTERLGCLIRSDDDEGHIGAGSFQSADSVSDLLFSISNSLAAASAHMSLGDSAESELQRRKIAPAMELQA